MVDFREWLNMSGAHQGVFMNQRSFGANQLWTWGRNLAGELGLNNTTARDSPVQVGSDDDWEFVARTGGGGQYRTHAIKTSGTMWSWGRNTAEGRLGINIGYDTFRSSPVQISDIGPWKTVAAGRAASVALKKAGSLWTWGQNFSGVLGNGLSSGYSRIPGQVGALTNWANVSMGSYFCIATKTDGTLWAWGPGSNGQLGIGIVQNRNSPTQIGSLTNWKQAAALSSACIAVKTDGTLWSWGLAGPGQLGRPGNNSSSPIQVGALTNWDRLATGYNHCLAIKTDGTLWSWGGNQYGSLGLGFAGATDSPMQIGALTTWDQVSCGRHFSHALDTSSRMFGWGKSQNYGQIGQGFSNRNSPLQIGGLTKWKKLSHFSSQARHGAALRAT